MRLIELNTIEVLMIFSLVRRTWQCVRCVKGIIGKPEKDQRSALKETHFIFVHNDFTRKDAMCIILISVYFVPCGRLVIVMLPQNMTLSALYALYLSLNISYQTAGE